MDSELKQSFDKLCSQFGMSSNAAMNVFAKAVVQSGRIPFEVVSDETAEKKSAADRQVLGREAIEQQGYRKYAE